MTFILIDQKIATSGIYTHVYVVAGCQGLGRSVQVLSPFPKELKICTYTDSQKTQDGFI